MTDRQGESGGVLRLRNLAMIENIRRTEEERNDDSLQPRRAATLTVDRLASTRRPNREKAWNR
jgi:hypothetical protein